MNPINPAHLSPSEAEALLVQKFLEFLQAFREMDGEGVKPARPASFFIEAIQNGLKGGTPLKFPHQVQLLAILQKTKTEIESFLEKAEEKPGAAPLPKRGPQEPFKKIELFLNAIRQEGKTASAEKRFVSLAEVSEKKAAQILGKKGEVSFEAKDSRASFERIGTELKTGLLKREPLKEMIDTFLAILDPRKTIERTPPLEIMRQMKPLVDHLIVVVETQQDMEHPSQKTVQLIRSLSQAPTFFKQLSGLALFKPEPSLKQEAASSKELSFSEKKSSPVHKTLPSSEPSIEKPREPVLGTFKRASSAEPPPSSQRTELEKTSLEASKPFRAPTLLPKDPTPWAAPYVAPKTARESRFKPKKKEKGFWRKKEKEDEDPLNS